MTLGGQERCSNFFSSKRVKRYKLLKNKHLMQMKNYFEHKDYIGTVEYSTEDNVFYGKILDINDLLTFEGSSVAELEDAFKETVNDYLDTCKELDKQI